MSSYVPLPVGAFLKNKRYRIERELKAGGFGAVYLAEDFFFVSRKGAASSGRPCVIKENFDQSPKAREQFEKEAAVLSTLSHPHLVRVTDTFVEPGGKMYLVMEYIDGEDLEDRLDRAAAGLPENEVLVWMDQVLDAVAYCHAQTPPVIHRDIKPSNIRIRRADGKAILVDFGIAKIGDESVQTQEAARGYSPYYSPVEQHSMRGTGAYSDVYALGATLYHLVTGQPPPESTELAAGKPLPRPRALNPAISPLVEQVILTAMQLKAQDRYPNAQEMRLALQGRGTTCPHCGASIRSGAHFCASCGRWTGPTQPFVFHKSGRGARSLAELAQECDVSWDEARDRFWRGEFDAWLPTINEPALAQRARAIRSRHRDPSAALEEFLALAVPTRPRPVLAVQPTVLDAGRVHRGDTRVLTLTVTNAGRGYLHGAVACDPVAWLTAQPTTFACLAGAQQIIQIEVNAAALTGDEAGVPYNGRVAVQSNRGVATIPVRLAVVDPPAIALSPDRLDLGEVPFGASLSRTATISNQGGGNVQAVVRAGDDWITLVDAAGTPLGDVATVDHLVRGRSEVVGVVVESSRFLARGQHTSVLTVEAANAVAPVVNLPVTITVVPPYLLDPADSASAIDDRASLWRWCDDHWPLALAHLASGRLEACLRFLGEGDLAREAARCRQMADVQVGLETLARACGAPTPDRCQTNSGEVESALGFGFFPRLRRRPRTLMFRIQNQSARGYLHGYLDLTAPWLSVSQPRFGCRPGEIAEVEIVVDWRARPRRLFSFGEQLFDIVIE